MNWTLAVRRVRAEVLYYRLVAKDPQTPWLSKLLIGIAIAYLLSPIDIIPDFIPVLGQLDDVFVVPGLLWCAISLVPRHVQHKARAAAQVEESGVPAKKSCDDG